MIANQRLPSSSVTSALSCLKTILGELPISYATFAGSCTSASLNVPNECRSPWCFQTMPAALARSTNSFVTFTNGSTGPEGFLNGPNHAAKLG